MYSIFQVNIFSQDSSWLDSKEPDDLLDCDVLLGIGLVLDVVCWGYSLNFPFWTVTYL